MAKILDFNAKKPHNTGACICLNCRYEWVATAPVGVIVFECPSCRLMKGLFNYLCDKPDEYYFKCKCQNEHFKILADGTFMCALCGECVVSE